MYVRVLAWSAVAYASIAAKQCYIHCFQFLKSEPNV